MTKKKKEQVKSIVIIEDDDGFRMEWKKDSLSASEGIGMLEQAKIMLQTQIGLRYQNTLAQQQEEAK